MGPKKRKRKKYPKRGFASMKDRVRLREICVMGGQAAHQKRKGKKLGHEYKKGSKEAREAGRKGGRISRKRRTH